MVGRWNLHGKGSMRGAISVQTVRRAGSLAGPLEGPVTARARVHAFSVWTRPSHQATTTILAMQMLRTWLMLALPCAAALNLLPQLRAAQPVLSRSSPLSMEAADEMASLQQQIERLQLQAKIEAYAYAHDGACTVRVSASCVLYVPEAQGSLP